MPIGALQGARDGGFGGGAVALGLGIEPGAGALQLGLGQATAPFGDGGITFGPRQDGGHGHRQDGREGMPLAQFASRMSRPAKVRKRR